MSTSNAPHADRTEPDEVEGTSDDADDADADDADAGNGLCGLVVEDFGSAPPSWM